MTNKRKFYVVWKGRHTGIYTTWEECSRQVNEYTGAEYKSFENEAAAKQAWRKEYADYQGKFVPRLSQARLLAVGSPILPSYAVDASCLANPGVLEYRGVETETRKEIFRQGPFRHGTNNIGEFLALVHALVLLQPKQISLPIYSDSKDALNWVRAKKCRTNLARNGANAELFELIGRAETWLRDNTYPNKILKWETEAWGEIPADFGRK
jgi:ribonuclease HI